MTGSLRELAIQVELYERGLETAKKEYEEKLAKIKNRLAELRAQCPHPKWNNYTGSGNNDSWSSCDLCGEQG